MGTKEEIFNKIGDLLQDLNAQYLDLSEKDGTAELSDWVSLEAKAQSVAAYITLLKTDTVLQGGQVQNTLKESALESKKIAFNDYFTPPSSIRIANPPIVETENTVQHIVDSGTSKNSNEAAVEAQAEVEETVELPAVSYTPKIADEANSTAVDQAPPTTPEATVEPVEENQYTINEPKIDLIDEEPVVVTEVIEEPKQVIIKEVQENLIQEEVNTVMEEAPSRPLTLNEIISQQKQAGVQNRVYQVNQSGSSDKLTDIKTGISLNDKLLFIKDLFNGYSLAYSEAVELLNRFSSYAEADAFLQTNYAIKNRWADKPHTVEKLYEVLRRRYS
ncbi:hypothetical protein [Sphingobacterium athyrii]|uniref:Uncharacterized protein n=1 Tax=Sphingobacterium athyrii TaxID=2152717 RepID=A0A363NVG6_9SPHI|nr:hypothetical protein [Sphingobacterium athyrii]PUV24641.1 hypothetical protein DCO56_06540 [Sphingobacterium athyrii]